jgi:hypothetical protein
MRRCLDVQERAPDKSSHHSELPLSTASQVGVDAPGGREQQHRERRSSNLHTENGGIDQIVNGDHSGCDPQPAIVSNSRKIQPEPGE